MPFILDPERDEDRWYPVTETRWIVHALPSTPLHERLHERLLHLVLSVATDDQEVIEAVEGAAERSGMVIERLAVDPPPRYPATHDD